MRTTRRERAQAVIARLAAAKAWRWSRRGNAGGQRPGARLVRAAHEAAIRWRPCRALARDRGGVGGGLAAETFVFAGFPPTQAKARARGSIALRACRRPS
jgi:16S rRNA C1402 (ribose-2'-O) methylase RsmI